MIKPKQPHKYLNEGDYVFKMDEFSFKSSLIYLNPTIGGMVKSKIRYYTRKSLSSYHILILDLVSYETIIFGSSPICSVKIEKYEDTSYLIYYFQEPELFDFSSWENFFRLCLMILNNEQFIHFKLIKTNYIFSKYFHFLQQQNYNGNSFFMKGLFIKFKEYDIYQSLESKFIC